VCSEFLSHALGPNYGWKFIFAICNKWGNLPDHLGLEAETGHATHILCSNFRGCQNFCITPGSMTSRGSKNRKKSIHLYLLLHLWSEKPGNKWISNTIKVVCAKGFGILKFTLGALLHYILLYVTKFQICIFYSFWAIGGHYIRTDGLHYIILPCFRQAGG